MEAAIGLTKFVVKPIYNNKSFTKWRCNRKMSEKVELNTRNKYIPNKIHEFYSKRFVFGPGGVHVVAAPQGIGKSTGLRNCVNKFIDDNGKCLYLHGNDLINITSKFHSLVDVNSHAHGSKFFDSIIPDKSVVILDQLEIPYKRQSDREDIQSFIKDVATHTRRTGRTNIIVATSNPNIASDVLSLNGLDKIRLACNPEDHRWSENEILQYLENINAKRVGDRYEFIEKMGILSGNFGFINDVLGDLEQGICDEHKIEDRAQKIANSWNHFSSL